GVYLRLHAGLGDAQPTFFMDGHTVEAIPPVLFPDEARQRGNHEMAHLGKVHVPVWIDGGTVLRARRAGDRSGWAFDGAAMGVRDRGDVGPGEQRTAAYAGDRGAVKLGPRAVAEKGWRGLLSLFRADGAAPDDPPRGPPQLDRRATPRAGGPADAATPRVVVP